MRCRSFSMLVLVAVAGCKKAASDPAAEAPPHADVVPAADVAEFAVDRPEQFPLVTATARTVTPELAATGVVSADITRNVPVTSLATGRVQAIRARVGDVVKKGQVLLTLRSDDVSGGIAEYRKAVADEALARAQLERAKDLYEHGAISLNDQQLAENVENKAKVDVETTAEHLRLLGASPGGGADAVTITAPAAGVITDQQVTVSSVLQSSASAFTISDLSQVWVMCDVYENDLRNVRVGDAAEIRIAAYPDQPLKGTIGNISPILDPNLRTAKVRIELANPDLLRLGMFVTATFHGQTPELHVVVPATAVARLHDRDWVYVPAPGGKFRRVEVVAGRVDADKTQEIRSGLEPGQQVVANALVLDHAIEE